MVELGKAEEYFSGLIKNAPGNAFGYMMRGVARFENDDMEHAGADFDDALRVSPEYVPALTARAQLWQWQGKLDRAIADATKAIELETNNSYAHVERGIFLLNAKKYAEAASDLTKAIALGSNAAVAHVALGICHLEKKEFARAESEFHKAIELDPKHPDAYAGNASLYLVRGKGAAAISVLNQAIVADPQNPEPYGHRASVYLLLGNDAKALADLNEVIRIAPHSARALRQRAWILITCADGKNRRPREAVESATRACELTEWNEPRALTALAAACSETGDFASAVRSQQKALDRVQDTEESRLYRKLLERYKAAKPYHRLSNLQESSIPAISSSFEYSAGRIAGATGRLSRHLGGAMREQLFYDSLDTIIWNVDSLTGPSHQSPAARSGPARNQANGASSKSQRNAAENRK
jgi:Tfp pilus assembly protein PilF